jgi:hypothetical protein
MLTRSVFGFNALPVSTNPTCATIATITATHTPSNNGIAALSPSQRVSPSA